MFLKRDNIIDYIYFYFSKNVVVEKHRMPLCRVRLRGSEGYFSRCAMSLVSFKHPKEERLANGRR